MKRFKTILAFISVLLLISIFFYPSKAETEDKGLIVFSVPKSGTHLLLKCLSILMDEKFYYIDFDSNNFSEVIKKKYIWTHLNNSEFKYNAFIRSLKYRAIVQIRDIRDVVMSYVNWILKDPNTPKKTIDEFKNLSLEDKITYVINCDFLEDCLKNIHIWLNNPDVFVCKFEDLVGENGGGLNIKQREIILKLSDYINFPIKEDKLDFIEKHLFGNREDDKFISVTFFSGQIGKWKNFFNEKHKELFKKKYGKTLMLLGYEKDSEW